MDAQQRSSAGFSMIELVIASSLLALMVYAVSTLAVSGGEAQEYARRLTRATEVNQDLADRMRLEMVSSVRIFGNDAEGNANLALLDLSAAPVPLATSRLPTVSATESFRADTTGAEITGNSLFFTRLAWSDRFACSSGNEYLVDVYRWVYYYLTPVDGGPQADSAVGLNLVRVVSEPLADASGIDRITDATDQKEVLLHLLGGTPGSTGTVNPPCQVVWVRGGLPATLGTLRQIDSSGALSDVPVDGRPDPWEILLASAPDEMLTFRHHSIGTNYSRTAFGVGRYSVLDNTGEGFPHGFEVQVVGPSSARQLMLHLVVVSTARRGHTAWSDVQVSVDARDL